MIKFIPSISVCCFLLFFSGINNLFADNLFFTDSIPPSPTLNAGSLQVGGPFIIGVGFSENVIGLTADDFVVENGEVLEVEGENMNYTVLIDPLAVGIVRFKVPGGVVVDEAGNENVPSGTLSVTFTDEEEPTVVLSTPQNSVDTVFPVNILFSEPVSGLTIDDFNISNGAGVDLTGVDTSFLLMVNPGATGAVSVFLPAAVVVDTAGNSNQVSNFLQVNFGPLDVTAPEVILSTATTEVSENFIVEIRFSEEITDLELSDFNVINAELNNLSGNGNVFTMEASPLLEGNISIQLAAESIVDLFDNPNAASNELIVNYLVPLAPDTIRPQIFLEDLTSGSEGTYEVQITFSESVTDLTAENLVLNNAVVSSLTQNIDSYTLEIEALDFGMVEFFVPENVVTDEADNGNLASTNLSWEYEDNLPVNPEPVFDIVVNRIADAVQVDWFTNTEIENAYFEIWYSVDGINYTNLQQINSTADTEGIFPYNYTHLSPVFGTNYYYVRRYNSSGSFIDSDIAVIDFLNLHPEALIYPNPANQMVTFNTTEYAGKRCEVMVYNALGQIFMLDIYEALPVAPIELSIGDFPKGVYGVQFWIKETAKIESSFVIMR